MPADPRCWTDLAEENARLRKLLIDFLAVNDEPCRLDHHGYCQAHWLHSAADCPVARARTAIGETHAQASFDHEGAPR